MQSVRTKLCVYRVSVTPVLYGAGPGAWSTPWQPGGTASSGALGQTDKLVLAPHRHRRTTADQMAPCFPTGSNAANPSFEPHQAGWRHPSGLEKAPEEPRAMQRKHHSLTERSSVCLHICWIQPTILWRKVPPSRGTSQALSAVITPKGECCVCNSAIAGGDIISQAPRTVRMHPGERKEKKNKLMKTLSGGSAFCHHSWLVWKLQQRWGWEWGGGAFLKLGWWICCIHNSLSQK